MGQETVVVNVAFGVRYRTLQDGLKKSCTAAGVSSLMFDGVPQGWRSHQESPYAFKVQAIEEAKKHGYSIVIWADSILRCVRYPAGVSLVAGEQGVMLLNDGWNSGEWCADSALAPLGVTREESFAYPHCHACLMAFNFDSRKGNEAFDRWKEAERVGAFQGPWKNDKGQASSHPSVRGHRHDQTAISIIAKRLGIPFVSPDGLLDYSGGVGGDFAMFHERAPRGSVNPIVTGGD